MVVGILLPGGHQFTFLIRYFLMAMLFFAFLTVKIEKNILTRAHLKILLLNLLLPIVFFFLIKPINLMAAMSTFIITSAPTAAGAPVIAYFLDKKVSFVTASVILTAPIVALIIPFTLPLVMSVEGNIGVWQVMKPIVFTVFVPLAVAQLLRWVSPRAVTVLTQFKQIAFILLVVNIYLATANAVHFIVNDEQSTLIQLLWIAAAISVAGFIQFKLGEWIGRDPLKVETGLALGRKNTVFALYIALTFLNPLVALGPVFYIVFHNSYNSWQMYSLARN